MSIQEMALHQQGRKIVAAVIYAWLWLQAAASDVAAWVGASLESSPTARRMLRHRAPGVELVTFAIGTAVAAVIALGVWKTLGPAILTSVETTAKQLQCAGQGSTGTGNCP